MKVLRKYGILFIMTFISFFIQSTVLPHISLGSVHPNLLIILTTAIGFIMGRREGIYTGLFCGIMADVLYESPFSIGAYALIYVCIGYATGAVRERIYEESRFLPIAFIMGSDFLYGLINFLIFFLLRSRFSFFYYLGHVILPEMIYTALLALLIYPLVRYVIYRLDKYEQRRKDSFV